MLSDYLKYNSQKDHDSIESSVDLLKLVSSEGDYLKLVNAFYGYYQPTEKKLMVFERELLEFGIHLNERLKSNLLKVDLGYFHLSSKQVAIGLCPYTPDVHDVYEAMAVLYVLEGSTMGGQIISRQLMKSKMISDKGEGGTFFKPYGANTAAMWLKFKEALNKIPKEQEDHILCTVKKTFHSMEKWLVQNT